MADGGRNDLAKGLGSGIVLDAWGKQKVTTDFSLFHGIWTYDVPNRVWEEFSLTLGSYSPLTQTGTLVSSVDNMLEVKSGTVAGNGGAVFSKRHPRYQPNRGHLYSTALILPSATSNGVRKFGLFKNGNGVYFQLEGNGSTWTMYAVRKSNGTEENKQDITSLLPSGFDPEKNNVYDIQYQWRSAGDYFFYVNLESTYAEENLGTLSGTSIRLPALPVGYSAVTNTTTEIKILAGCVDVTSEGGKREGRQFASVSTGVALLKAGTAGTAMLAVRMPRNISYGGGTIENTRDIVASKLTGWSRDEASLQVWFARDTVATALGALTWAALPDSVTGEYLVGGNGSTLNTAFQSDKSSMQLVLNEWDDLEKKNVVINPDQSIAPFYVTPGDIMVCVIQTIAGNDDNATTLYLSEEI